MPEMTLVTKLMADATQFRSGTDSARASTDSLRGSVNSIIGQLERQKKAFEQAGRSTRDWIEADKDASAEAKELANSLLKQVDALKQLERAKKGVTVVDSSPMGALLKPDYFGRGLARMGAQSAIDAERLKKEESRNAADPFLRGMASYQQTEDPFQRGLRTMQVHREKALKDEEEYKTRRLKSGQELDALQEKQERESGERISRQQQDRAQRRQSQQEIADAREKSRRTAQDRRDDANVNRQLNEQQYGRRPGSDYQPDQKRDNRKWAGVEGFRAIEDFAQGSAYGGLRGGLLAASNNISQMGATFGAFGAMAGSALSTTIVLGSQLYETWRKAASGADAAAAALKEYDRTLGSVVSHSQQMLQSRMDLRDVRDNFGRSQGQSAQDIKAQKDAIALEEQRLRDERDARADRDRGMGTAGVFAGDRDRERTRREGDWFPFVNSVIRMATGQEQQVHRLPDEVLNKDATAQAREEERQIIRDNEKLNAHRQRLIELEKEHRRNSQREDENAMREMKQAAASLAAHRRGGRGERTEWEQIQDRRDRNNAQNAKEKDRFESGQAWFQRDSESMMLDGMTPLQREAYRAQKDHTERLLKSEEAARLGVITPDERAKFDAASVVSRDRQLREAKFGGMQADGQSGFGSQDARSTGGMNAIIKAIRFGEQDRAISELKRNGDISEDLAASIKDGVTIKNLAPVPIVTF